MLANTLYSQKIVASKTKAPAKFLSTQARRLAMGEESFGGNVEDCFSTNAAVGRKIDTAPRA